MASRSYLQTVFLIVSSKRRRRNKSTKRVQPNDQRVVSDKRLEPTIYLNKDSTEKPIAPAEEAKDKLLDEPLSFGTKKKGTFDLNVQTYENNSSQDDEKYESEEEKEQKQTKQMQSEDDSRTTRRRDGRRSRAEILEQYLPDHNESISSVLDKFGAMGIDTPGLLIKMG